MAKTYTYTFLAKDLMSSKLSKIAGFGKRMGNDVENANERVRRSSRRTQNSIAGLQKVASKWIGAIATYQTFTGIAKLGMDMETTRLKFETLTGSAEAGNKMIANLDQFANRTPFDNADLRTNAELLLNFGIAGNKVLPTLKMIGDVSGGNKQKLNSLTLAFAQATSTGKLMGQDLLQMINAGFNPLQIISEKTGRSMASLKEDMSKGKIGADMVEEAFRIATSEGGRFHGMMDKISGSAGGKLSTMLGTLRSKVAKWSESSLTPILGKIFDFGTQFINGFGVVSDAVKKLLTPLQPLWQAISQLAGLVFGFSNETLTASSALQILTNIINFLAVPIEIFATGLTKIITWLKPVAPIIKVIAIAYGVWTAAQWALNIAMTANPIGLIIAAIAALVGGIIYAYNKIGWFRGGIKAIWETMKGFGNAIKTLVVDRIKQMIAGITGIGSTLMHFFKGDWKKAWETGKKAVQNLTGIGVGNGKKLMANMKATGKNAAAAYNKGVKEAEANKAKKSGGILDILGANKVTQNATNGGFTPKSSLPEGLGKGIDTITGGGSKQTNITVNFDKLVENYTVSTQTFEQGMDESMDSLKRMLLRVMNSVNQMQTSPA